MTFETMLLWQKGDFEQFEKIIKQQEDLYKKLINLNELITFEENAKGLLKFSDNQAYKQWQRHDVYLQDLINLRLILLDEIKTNNNRLQKEFY